jgi:hypothetical protein
MSSIIPLFLQNMQIDPEWRKQAEKVDLSFQLNKSGCVMLVPVKVRNLKKNLKCKKIIDI